MNIGQVSVPDLIRVFRKCDTIDFLLRTIVENADLHFCSVSGEDSEIGAFTVPCGAARIWQPLANPAPQDCGRGIRAIACLSCC